MSSLCWCLSSMVVLAYLGAVGYGFICNQWNMKGMNTDIYFSGTAIWDQRQIAIHSAVRIFSWLFWIVGSCLCLTSTQHFKVCHPRCVCNSLGGRRIVKTTQLIRKKVFILICINYTFRPTVAIIRFIANLKGSHISGWLLCVDTTHRSRIESHQ